MTTTPDRHLLACSEVLYRAALEARLLAWECGSISNRLSGDRERQIAALMDAIHNIPHLMLDWERCNQKLMRDLLLAYDAEWSSHLTVAYDNVVETGSVPDRLFAPRKPK